MNVFMQRMNLRPVIGASMLMLALLAGCASQRAVVHLHSLLPGLPPTAFAPASAAGGAAIEALPMLLDPVSMPPQVDRPQWLVRLPDDSMMLLEQERWAGPLADEWRAALLEHLSARWGAVDAVGPGGRADGAWRLRVDVTRFESLPDREIWVQARWSLTPPPPARGSTAATTVSRCSSRVQQPVDAGMQALALGHRIALSRIADDIGAALQALHAGRRLVCHDSSVATR